MVGIGGRKGPEPEAMGELFSGDSLFFYSYRKNGGREGAWRRRSHTRLERNALWPRCMTRMTRMLRIDADCIIVVVGRSDRRWEEVVQKAPTSY